MSENNGSLPVSHANELNEILVEHQGFHSSPNPEHEPILSEPHPQVTFNMLNRPLIDSSHSYDMYEHVSPQNNQRGQQMMADLTNPSSQINVPLSYIEMQTVQPPPQSIPNPGLKVPISGTSPRPPMPSFQPNMVAPSPDFPPRNESSINLPLGRTQVSNPVPHIENQQIPDPHILVQAFGQMLESRLIEFQERI